MKNLWRLNWPRSCYNVQFQMYLIKYVLTFVVSFSNLRVNTFLKIQNLRCFVDPATRHNPSYSPPRFFGCPCSQYREWSLLSDRMWSAWKKIFSLKLHTIFLKTGTIFIKSKSCAFFFPLIQLNIYLLWALKKHSLTISHSGWTVYPLKAQRTAMD